VSLTLVSKTFCDFNCCCGGWRIAVSFTSGLRTTSFYLFVCLFVCLFIYFCLAEWLYIYSWHHLPWFAINTHTVFPADPIHFVLVCFLKTGGLRIWIHFRTSCYVLDYMKWMMCWFTLLSLWNKHRNHCSQLFTAWGGLAFSDVWWEKIFCYHLWSRLELLFTDSIYMLICKIVAVKKKIAYKN